jgi:hypothetical protein
MNTEESPRKFTVTVEGVPGIKVVDVEQPIAIGGESLRLVPVRLQAPAEAGKPGANRIDFVIAVIGDGRVAWREKSTFLFPR